MSNEKLVTFLREADNLISEYGWVQKQYGNTDVGHCMLGAIYSRILDDRLCWRGSFTSSQIRDCRRTAHLLLEQEVKQATDECYMSIARFNDAPGRSAEDVHQIFKNTIEKVEAQ